MQKAILISLIVACLLGFYFFIYDLLTPSMVVASPKEPIQYRYHHDDDQYVHLPLRVTLWARSKDPAIPIDDVALFYSQNEPFNFRFILMEREVLQGKPTGNYLALLPPLEKGKRYFFYFRLVRKDGKNVKITQKKNWALHLLTGPGTLPFYVTYEGRVTPGLLALHITFVMAALIFLVHTFYYALLLHGGNGSGGRRIKKTLFWGWVFFTIAVIPLGIWVTHEAFGVGWGGWPLGSDITDTKSEILVLYWLGVMVLAKKEKYLPKLPWWVYGGILLTALIYAIPHSLFIIRW